MPNYQKLYTTMFNAATDAIAAIEEQNLQKSRQILIQAQQNCEELFLSSQEEKPLK